jgi:hypothetical protein
MNQTVANEQQHVVRRELTAAPPACVSVLATWRGTAQRTGLDNLARARRGVARVSQKQWEDFLGGTALGTLRGREFEWSVPVLLVQCQAAQLTRERQGLGRRAVETSRVGRQLVRHRILLGRGQYGEVRIPEHPTSEELDVYEALLESFRRNENGDEK